MRKKLIGVLLAVIVFSMTLPMVSIATQVTGANQAMQIALIGALGTTSSPDVVEVTATSGFYDDLGTIYSVRTQDGVYIKVLRYHPPGQSFNTGKQPILLFPGILANINEFLSHSTPRVKQFYNVTLPNDIADWAKGDKNIEKDPLLYYSIAYYLWKQGYDVWLANYRGVGYKEMKSGEGSSKTSLDKFALYDARAAIGLVYDKTGKHPVVGGHSTGGLVTMMLLQGTYINTFGRVVSSDSLVKQRNGITEGRETIKGFIALEPAGIPTITKLLDTYLGWMLLDTGLFLDLRSIIELLDGQGRCSMIYILEEVLSQFGPYIKDIVENILNMDLTDLTPALGYYHMAYSLDGVYFDTLAQYADFAFNRVIREYFKNGILNQYRIEPPTPLPGIDGYYYYTGSNMKKMRVPIIAILATHQNNYLDLVNATEIIEDFIKGKTPSPYDCYVWVEGAHIDAPIGIRAPAVAFPAIGAWLKAIA
ncbi:MAG: alpha/beta hydrolase [Candidatus Jordarchaeaceae archaeon]